MADRGMGRGLAAILTSSAGEITAERGHGLPGPGFDDLPVDLIEPNPNQPRRSFDEQALAELADSIAAQGLLQPVLVRPRPAGRYEIVAGERRWRAARLAGMETVPVLIAERGDAESLEAALVENVAREDLNPVEEARAIAGLVDDLGLSRQDVARRIGRGRVAVSNLLRLLELPDEVLSLLERRRLTEGHGRALLLAADHGDRRRLGLLAAEQGWSVRVTEERARAAGTPRPRRRPETHPDQVAAAEEITAVLEPLFGAELKVRPAGDAFRVELALTSPSDARALVQRLRGGRDSR